MRKLMLVLALFASFTLLVAGCSTNVDDGGGKKDATKEGTTTQEKK